MSSTETTNSKNNILLIEDNLLMLEKLFQYITSHIINHQVFDHFHKSLSYIDSIDDKRQIVFDKLETEQRMNDTIEFMEVFIKNSKLDIYFETFLNKLCDVGINTFTKIIDDCSEGLVDHVLDGYRVIVSSYFSKSRSLYPVYISIFYEYIKKFHKNLEKRKLIYENI